MSHKNHGVKHCHFSDCSWPNRFLQRVHQVCLGGCTQRNSDAGGPWAEATAIVTDLRHSPCFRCCACSSRWCWDPKCSKNTACVCTFFFCDTLENHVKHIFVIEMLFSCLFSLFCWSGLYAGPNCCCNAPVFGSRPLLSSIGGRSEVDVLEDQLLLLHIFEVCFGSWTFRAKSVGKVSS